MESGQASVARRRRWTWGVLVIACAAVLLFHAGHGFRVTRDLVAGPWRNRADAAEAQLDCLARRIDELVPAGSRVYVGPGPGVELQQRISELVVYADSDVVDDPAVADLVLDSGPVTAAGCQGVSLGTVPA